MKIRQNPKVDYTGNRAASELGPAMSAGRYNPVNLSGAADMHNLQHHLML
jgi:hypothetical protein